MDRDPRVRTARLSALVFLDRLDQRGGREADADALVREIAALGLKQPVLLWAPPIEDLKRNAGEGELGRVPDRAL